jgi:hypothetical protein
MLNIEKIVTNNKERPSGSRKHETNVSTSSPSLIRQNDLSHKSPNIKNARFI